MSALNFIPQLQLFKSECADWPISNTDDQNWLAYETIRNLCLEVANSMDHILEIDPLDHTGSVLDSESEDVSVLCTIYVIY